MAFRGILRTGSDVEALFLSDVSNDGPALLLIALGKATAGADTDGDVAAPGGRARVELKRLERGFLELVLDVKLEADKGRLQLFADGQMRDDEAIEGDTRWTYLVKAQPGA